MTVPRRSLILFLLLLLFMTVSPLAAQPLRVPLETPAMDKAFSEFNHHVAGYFLIAVGLSAFLGSLSPRLAFINKIWPFFFILPGLYLAFMSDPDVWPMGNQSLPDAFRSNAEAAQHKIYAALLLAMGIVEFQRERGKLGKVLATWSFPLLALFGAILLFFHPHQTVHMTGSISGMHHADHVMTESMLKVKQEHLWFSVVGFCVVVFKLLSDSRANRLFRFLWPSCIALLGVLLVLYSE